MNIDQIGALLFTLLIYYQYALFIYILLTWFPAMRGTVIFDIFEALTRPFFRIFSGWLRIGQMDLTPLFGILLYGMLLNFAAGNLS